MTPKIRTKTYRIAGRTVSVSEVGSGQPVLCLHGCGSLSFEILSAFRKLPRGLRLIAVDRPGYGASDPLPKGQAGAWHQARWLSRTMDRLGVPRALVVAHSLGAAPALCLTALEPARVKGLLLLAPFCRPTPHAAMPFLRLATAPGIGALIRAWIIPRLADWLGPRQLASALHPNPVPPHLLDFPYAQAAQPNAVLTMAAELRAFNEAMAGIGRRLARFGGPVTAIVGLHDRVALPHWHCPWLTERLRQTRVVAVDGVGHAPQHAAPDVLAGALAELASTSERQPSRELSQGASVHHDRRRRFQAA